MAVTTSPQGNAATSFFRSTKLPPYLEYGRDAAEARKAMGEVVQSPQGKTNLLASSEWAGAREVQTVVIAAAGKLLEYMTVEVVPLSAELDDLLAEIASLEDNWDGYGALPPTPWALATARWVLNSLSTRQPPVLEDVYLVPSTDGGVRLEWMRIGSRDLVVILPRDPLGLVVGAKPRCCAVSLAARARTERPSA